MSTSHPSGAVATAPALLVAHLQQTIDQVLRPLLADTPVVALLGFPSYANVGDSAIWLGTTAYLRSIGITRPQYMCDHSTYWRERLARRIGRGTILLQGGGNLGDVWELHQPFRELIIDTFRDNPIIQLPQSIHFREPQSLARARAVFDRHPNLTLLVRDQQSLTIARNEFRARSVLCPDMAFCLGPLSRPTAPAEPIVWLARADRESAHAVVARERVDWLTERGLALLLTRRLALTQLLQVRGVRWLGEPLSWTYDWLARQRLQRGCRLLSAGRVVVTDRLHGHILSMLLGIPHVLLDNSYGKLSSFYDTWTHGSELAHWCNDANDALRVAGEVATPRV